MRNLIDRYVFLVRTRVNVFYSNYQVTQAFGPGKAFVKEKFKYAVAGLLVLFIVGAGIGSNFFIGKSTATIPEIETVQIIPKEITIPEPLPPPAIAILPELPTNYMLAVDKANKKLLILKEEREYYEVVQSYEISLGQMIGAKEKEGDLRTPEGFYKILEIKNDEELADLYGPRAFVLDYPNRFDVADGRTGGGIWLHGSGQGLKTPDTRGCVELDDPNIIALGQWAKIGTEIAIFPENFSLPIIGGRIEKGLLTREFFYGDFTANDRLAAVQ